MGGITWNYKLQKYAAHKKILYYGTIVKKLGEDHSSKFLSTL